MGSATMPVDLGQLTNYFMFLDGNAGQSEWKFENANGVYGDIGFNLDKTQDGGAADEFYVTKGNTMPYRGDVYADITEAQADPNGDGSYDNSVFHGDQVEGNTQASAVWEADTVIDGLTSDFHTAFDYLDDLPATLSGTKADIFNQLTGNNEKLLNSYPGKGNGVSDTVVIDITDGGGDEYYVVDGDAEDIFVFRWDKAGNYGTSVMFEDGGGVVPLDGGNLTPGNFVHLAGVLESGGGGVRYPSLPCGPSDNEFNEVVTGAEADCTVDGNFNEGGFFVGYWLTIGASNNENGAFSNSNFAGGWYTNNTKFNFKSDSSGIHWCPNAAAMIVAATDAPTSG